MYSNNLGRCGHVTSKQPKPLVLHTTNFRPWDNQEILVHDNYTKYAIWCGIEIGVPYLPLSHKWFGNHKVFEFWSKGHIINFHTSIRETPFTICLRYAMMHLSTIGFEREAWVVEFIPLRKLGTWVLKMQTELGDDSIMCLL